MPKEDTVLTVHRLLFAKEMNKAYINCKSFENFVGKLSDGVHGWAYQFLGYTLTGSVIRSS